jgi:hypothetical protein
VSESLEVIQMPISLKAPKYILRKLVIEAKHSANLLHSQKVGPALQELVPEFDKVLQTGGGAPDSIQLIADAAQRKLLSEWNRLWYTEESPKDPQSASANAKRLLGPLQTKLGIENFQRVGIRTWYLIPSHEKYELLLEWFHATFFTSLEAFTTFGKVKDSGVFAITGTDDRYGFNLNIAPLHKGEFTQKVSDFKATPDTIDNNLMIDLDLFLEKGQYKLGSVIEDAVDQSRLKVVQFLEQLPTRPE